LGYRRIMMELRKLEVCDKDKLEELIQQTETNLGNELFWLPIGIESREHFFDDDWTYFLGMFDKEKLIAAVGLFLNKNEYGESEKILQLENYKIAEIGRAMVAPEYRYKGLMNKITQELIIHAKNQGIQYLVATVHPQKYSKSKSGRCLGNGEERTLCKTWEI
jgi:GNAT superfamily N-acetyltransferase